VCSCAEYEHIEFLRKAVRKRINASRSLKKSLALLMKHPDGEHKLYRCTACDQMWQGSRAWNWGNDEYLFRVPDIKEGQWIKEVFVQPDELLIFTAVLGDFLSANRFTVLKAPCGVDGCRDNAVSGTSTCLRHHVEALQRVHQLPETPTGRWFEPYARENIVPAL
jgi:hypothetical protein